MIKLIKQSFKIVLDTPIIPLFLVSFLVIISVFAQFALKAHTNQTNFILLICILSLYASFFAGWFQVIKEAGSEKKDKKYLSIFFEGVGLNTISIITGFFIYIATLATSIAITSKISNILFGDIKPIVAEILSSNQTNASSIEITSALPQEKQFIIYSYSALILIVITIIAYLFMFYFPAILNSKNKNPFIRSFAAIKDTLKFLYKNFLPTLGMYILFSVSAHLLFFLDSLCAQINILSLITLFINLYFISAMLMIIFNYYEQKNNCDNRSDSNGEDKPCDKISSED